MYNRAYKQTDIQYSPTVEAAKPNTAWEQSDKTFKLILYHITYILN